MDMLMEQLERREVTKPLEMANMNTKPLDMSKQQEENAGSQRDRVGQRMELDGLGHHGYGLKELVGQGQERKTEVICPKLENLQEHSPPRSEADAPTSPPRSDIEQR